MGYTPVAGRPQLEVHSLEAHMQPEDILLVEPDTLQDQAARRIPEAAGRLQEGRHQVAEEGRVVEVDIRQVAGVDIQDILDIQLVAGNQQEDSHPADTHLAADIRQVDILVEAGSQPAAEVDAGF